MPKRLEEITLIFKRERIRFSGSDVAILECRPEVGEGPEQKAKDFGDDCDVDGNAGNTGLNAGNAGLSEATIDDILAGASFLSGAGWLDKSSVKVKANGSSDADEVIVKTECRPGDLVQGLSYRFYGTWHDHAKYGRQFIAKTFVRVQPHGRAGTIRYLMQAPCVGQVTATTLWDKFQGDAVRILREEPDVAAAAVDRFSRGSAAEASVWLRGQARTEGVEIDLMDLLGGRGFPRNTGKRAVEEWGNRAAEFIRRNPYILGRFRGGSFIRCDQLYHDLGYDPARLKRQALCASYILRRDREGHTWHRPALLEAGLRDMVAGTNVRPFDAARLAKRAGIIATRKDDNGNVWVADSAKARNEGDIAERVADWMEGEPAWPSMAGVDFGEDGKHQRQKCTEALTRQIAILTGGPGTGKTFAASRIIGEILRVFGQGVVAIAAPTGKAAVRITEVMQGYGIDLRARTIHSLLGVESKSEGDGWGFVHGPNNPLPYWFIVIDESSMIDTDLAASLFRACGTGTHILLVGDVGQLPPVGHGAPLRDLIAAGVPTGELTEIRRNSGMIVQACHAIRHGQRFQVCDTLRPEVGENLRLLGASSAAQAVERIVQTIKAIGAAGLADPIWDCQVIVAVNKKSELSRKAINKRLQGELNPTGKTAGDNPFRIGDKIVCLENSWMPIIENAPPGFNEETDADGKKVYVANGEQAAVKHVEPNLTVVQLDAPARLVKIPRGNQSDGDAEEDSEESAGTGCQWDLAYGVSCHKAQGSEWKVIFVVLDEHYGAKMVCSREWLYTAMSRAKTVCFLVGRLSTAYDMIDREAIRKRKTFLAERIGEEVAKRIGYQL